MALWASNNRRSCKAVCEIDVNRQRETVRHKAAIKAITDLRYAVVICLGLGVGIVSSIYFQHRKIRDVISPYSALRWFLSAR